MISLAETTLRDAMPAICPKCDYDLYAHRASKLIVVDVAHGGETISQALYKLEKAVDECLRNASTTSTSYTQVNILSR